MAVNAIYGISLVTRTYTNTHIDKAFGEGRLDNGLAIPQGGWMTHQLSTVVSFDIINCDLLWCSSISLYDHH